MGNKTPVLDIDFMGYQQKFFNRGGRAPTRREYCDYLREKIKDNHDRAEEIIAAREADITRLHSEVAIHAKDCENFRKEWQAEHLLLLEVQAANEQLKAEAKEQRRQHRILIDKYDTDIDKITRERDRLLTIAIREKTWRLEQDGCGGDEIKESIDKLKYEALNHKDG